MKLKQPDRPSRSDGLAGARFVVKSLVIVSFLVLITTFNYISTGQVPTLWETGDALSASTEHAVTFLTRGLKDDGEVRLSSDSCFKRLKLVFFVPLIPQHYLTLLSLNRTTAQLTFWPSRRTSVPSSNLNALLKASLTTSLSTIARHATPLAGCCLSFCYSSISTSLEALRSDFSARRFVVSQPP